MLINHLIDPTYFYDCVEEFSFNYPIYVLSNISYDAHGKQVATYEKNIIRGSLQDQGIRVTQEKGGNVKTNQFRFYCKSLYRINIGDVICYHNNYLRVNEVKTYDEYGVRSCTLEMIKLSNYRDLQAYINFLNGEELV